MLKTTTVSAVIKLLSEIFTRFRLPRVVVSDNGPPFTSRKYNQLMTKKVLKLPSLPYRTPRRNNSVKFVKCAIMEAIRDGIDVDIALQTYLLEYRNVEYSTTGVSPAVATT